MVELDIVGVQWPSSQNDEGIHWSLWLVSEKRVTNPLLADMPWFLHVTPLTARLVFCSLTPSSMKAVLSGPVDLLYVATARMLSEKSIVEVPFALLLE